MIIFVGAPSGDPSENELHNGWAIEQYFKMIRTIFGKSEQILFPPYVESDEPDKIFSVVQQNIFSCDKGIIFSAKKSSGPLIEAGLLATANKPMALIGSKGLIAGRIILGLPNLVGVAEMREPKQVENLLLRLRGTEGGKLKR